MRHSNQSAYCCLYGSYLHGQLLVQLHFSVISSSWSMWSPWSFCSNNVMVRVRACSTVRGFKCVGHNKVIYSYMLWAAKEQAPCGTLLVNCYKRPSNPKVVSLVRIMLRLCLRASFVYGSPLLLPSSRRLQAFLTPICWLSFCHEHICFRTSKSTCRREAFIFQSLLRYHYYIRTFTAFFFSTVNPLFARFLFNKK